MLGAQPPGLRPPSPKRADSPAPRPPPQDSAKCQQTSAPDNTTAMTARSRCIADGQGTLGTRHPGPGLWGQGHAAHAAAQSLTVSEKRLSSVNRHEPDKMRLQTPV
ncbi:hypothetical protein CapIbe_003330 [Capra ibex]